MATATADTEKQTASQETLDSAGLASILFCSVQMVTELARRGEIPGVFMCGQWLFVKAQVLEHLREKAVLEQSTRREAARAVNNIQENAVDSPSQSQNSVKRGRGRPRVPAVDLSGLLPINTQTTHAGR
ncbi:hypothetical protein RP726_05220 [Candidatus Methylospira mobilis]|uniref:hypothetical protein n=1 Tax=Candidatus Methylospira mobilis TaxID=1808979 RepID=UPI0028E8C820|nr:hypothetical protein [Candidatus Methylospira mobilis]WNV05819.1 hypothetical protein RP726_05220 [Candidatus Methylospira mobilis]